MSPGTDSLICLVPSCPKKLAGEKHTNNALLKEDATGLKYVCQSQHVSHHLWKREKTEAQEVEELVLGGDHGLAQLLHKTLGTDLVNIAGDGAQSQFYWYDEDSGLWKSVYNSFVRTELVTRLQKQYVKPLYEKYKKILYDPHRSEDSSKYHQAKVEAVEIKLEQLGSLNTSIKNHAKRHSILQDLMAIFRNEDISKLFNHNKGLLSVKNGVIDLRSGKLRARVREDFLTYECDVTYDHKADTSAFRQFITDITLAAEDRYNRPEVPEHWQRLFGYCITGYVNEQIFIILYGEGSNGKSVLMNCIQRVLGELFYVAPPELMCESGAKKSAGSATSYLAALNLKRIAFVNELPSDQRIDEALVKGLTGGGRTAVREVYSKQDSSGIEDTAKPIASANRLPPIEPPFVSFVGCV